VDKIVGTLLLKKESSVEDVRHVKMQSKIEDVQKHRLPHYVFLFTALSQNVLISRKFFSKTENHSFLMFTYQRNHKEDNMDTVKHFQGWDDNSPVSVGKKEAEELSLWYSAEFVSETEDMSSEATLFTFL